MGSEGAWRRVWASSCGFPPSQETANCQSRSAVAVTPRAASVASVTLLASAIARSVPTPALCEARHHGRTCCLAFPLTVPWGCPRAPTTRPLRDHLCPAAQSLVGNQAAPDGSRASAWGLWDLPRDCQKWLGGRPQRLLEVQETPPPPVSPHPPFHLSSQAQVEGLTCSHCRPHHFYLSASNPDGCVPCFCMGVTQQCASSSYSRHLVSARARPL